MKIFKRILWVLLSIVVVCGLSFVIYTSNFYVAVDVEEYLPQDIINLDTQKVINNSNVTYEHVDGNHWFYPNSNIEKEEAFVFYPGGKVEALAYAPIMFKLAEKGYISVIVEMPFNLAMFGINGANNVVTRETDSKNYSTKKWFIGGHSLGGAFAAKYYSQHSNIVNGLVLLASYSTFDLTFESSSVMCVYGSCDEVLNKDKYESSKSNLPHDFIEHIIDGGNHAQFASYGAQKGDGEATISSLEQWTLTTNYIVDFMNM